MNLPDSCTQQALDDAINCPPDCLCELCHADYGVRDGCQCEACEFERAEAERVATREYFADLAYRGWADSFGEGEAHAF